MPRGSKPGERRGGRKKGTPNKVPAVAVVALKEAILAAGEAAGGKEGMVGYLKTLALTNSSAYASLLGKVLPATLATDPEAGPLEHVIRWLPPQ